MTWLYILLGIILLILLILLIPIGFKAGYSDGVKAVLKIGFIPITLYPPDPKKAEKKKKKQEKKAKKKKPEQPEEEKPKEKKPSLIKEKGIHWLVDTIREAAKLATGALKSFFKHLKIKRLNISICYHGEDADDTAVKYGYFCLAVYPAVSAFVKVSKCKNYGIDIAPNFNEGAQSQYAVDIQAYIRVIWLFALAFRYGFKAIKLLISLKRGKTPKDKKAENEINSLNKGELNMAHPIDNLMNITMDKIKEMVDVNTIVGTPITSADGTLIIPVSKVSYGFASGGSDLPTKNEKKDLFGGGSGAGVTIQPIAFLTVYQGNVKLISVTGGSEGLDKVLGMVPDVVEKVKGFFKKDKKVKEFDVTDDFSEITIDDVDV